MVLTFNATDLNLYRAIETNHLVARQPLRSVGEPKRFLYVTPEVADGLDGNDPKLGHLPMGDMERLISNFCAGWLIAVSLLGDPDKKKPDMERLKDLDDVWVICARNPRHDQVRLLGRFLKAGVFVGMALHERRWLGFFNNYNKIAKGVPSLWVNALGNTLPFSATTVPEYLGGGLYRDVDEKF